MSTEDPFAYVAASAPWGGTGLTNPEPERITLNAEESRAFAEAIIAAERDVDGLAAGQPETPAPRPRFDRVRVDVLPEAAWLRAAVIDVVLDLVVSREFLDNFYERGMSLRLQDRDYLSGVLTPQGRGFVPGELASIERALTHAYFDSTITDTTAQDVLDRAADEARHRFQSIQVIQDPNTAMNAFVSDDEVLLISISAPRLSDFAQRGCLSLDQLDHLYMALRGVRPLENGDEFLPGEIERIEQALREAAPARLTEDLAGLREAGELTNAALERFRTAAFSDTRAPDTAEPPVYTLREFEQREARRRGDSVPPVDGPPVLPAPAGAPAPIEYPRPVQWTWNHDPLRFRIQSDGSYEEIIYGETAPTPAPAGYVYRDVDLDPIEAQRERDEEVDKIREEAQALLRKAAELSMSPLPTTRRQAVPAEPGEAAEPITGARGPTTWADLAEAQRRILARIDAMPLPAAAWPDVVDERPTQTVWAADVAGDWPDAMGTITGGVRVVERAGRT